MSNAASRLATFAYCRADVLVELSDHFDIVFAASARPELTANSGVFRKGVNFVNLISPDERQTALDILSSLRANGRLNDVTLHLSAGDVSRDAFCFSGYRVPDFDNNYFLAIKLQPRSTSTERTSSHDTDEESGVLGKAAFADAAVDTLRTLQEAGGEAAFSLIRLNNLDQLQRELGNDGYRKLLGKIGRTLKEVSHGENTAGRLSEGAFGLVHEKSIDEAGLRQSLDDASAELLSGPERLSADVEVIAVGKDRLSESELAKVVSYTMRKFTTAKGQVGVTNMAAALDRMTKENVSAVRYFKRICSTREFDFVYMPICDMKTKAIAHYEVLTRFPKTEGTGLTTFDMISLAEEAGVIREFDLAATRKAVNVLSGMAGQARMPSLAVNVSGQSILDEAFVSDLLGAVAPLRNLSKHFKFEITESAEIRDLGMANGHIQRIRDLGFGVALDDFGASAAGFDYLNELDVDLIKFDGPVVKRAMRTEKGKGFLSAMSALCAQSGIRTVAEMVEDEGLYRALGNFGIDYGQGYYFSKPQPSPF